MEILNSEINDLKEDIPQLIGLSDEYLFTIVASKYFYFEGEFNFINFENSYTDGKFDGGIDLVTISDSLDISTKELLLIQGKKINKLKSAQEAIDIFTKMAQTINDFKNKKTGKYNDRLKKILTVNLETAEEEALNIRLVLFLNTNVTKRMKTEIKKRAKSSLDLLDYELDIFTRSEIFEQINISKDNLKYVEKETISFYKKHGILEYTDNGILVNISSNSLRRLDNIYKDNGLYDRNYRFYVPNKKIDDKINSTLRSNRNNFWFLNNGIIIGCSSFKPVFNSSESELESPYSELMLENFSIINGCQTTTLIGKYDDENQEEDFAIPCKIVKPPKGVKFEEFIEDIAEASNSQKPITDRDLKSNSWEQKSYQEDLLRAEPPIFLAIKRGEPMKNIANEHIKSEGKEFENEKWRYVKNDFLGQLLLAFNGQQPGTARSNKKEIFSNDQTYKSSFTTPTDRELIVDLLKLYKYYEEIMKDKVTGNEILDPDIKDILINGGFYFISIIGFMIKNKRKIIVERNTGNFDEWKNSIKTEKIKGAFLKESENIKDYLDSLVINIAYRLKEVYYSQKSIKSEISNLSNFLKKDKTYYEDILTYIITVVYQDKFNREEMESKLGGILL